MKSLRYRQVHLDFHTSEDVIVGEKFNKEQFQAALKAGHINSITVFSKCHHGWSYHPTKVNKMHPNLKFDLLKAQLDACKEIGVNAPVYISAGYDEKYAREHTDHVVKNTPDHAPDFLRRAYYKLLCFNSPYLDELCKQIEEVMENYNPSGIFLDITSPRVCYCQYCIESMRKLGMDPLNPDDAKKHGEMVYENYCKRTAEAVRKYSDDATIFHNGSHITRGRRNLAYYNTHLELESLPTGGWGYDHFPLSAAYARTLDRDFLGMTGKFHKSWGEFGGYKHPNALRYEAALSMALGAKCSIGDQLHPSCEMNMSTYNLIGKAYKELELKEPYLENAKHISDVAILSAEAFNYEADDCGTIDVGASRILLEGKYLFDVIDFESCFDDYKLIILPDIVRIDEKLRNRINDYINNGGKILCTGESGLYTDRDEFAIDFGAEFSGKSPYTPSYMVPGYPSVNGETAYVMYSDRYDFKTDEITLASAQNPYFNRTPEHFFSHQHTPNNDAESLPGAVITENVGYIGWKVFKEYAQMGSYHIKELVFNTIKALLTEPTVDVNLPDRGVVTFTKQENRYIAHLLFAHTTIRGKDTEVIEDIIPLSDITIYAKLPKAPSKVYKVSCENGNLIETSLDFCYDNGYAKTITDVNMHAMIVFE